MYTSLPIILFTLSIIEGCTEIHKKKGITN